MHRYIRRHPHQSSSWVSSATPLFTQNLYGLLLFSLHHITKFVLCPVVESTPLLADVLYTGDL